MLTTAFTELIGCSVPLQQAGMGSVATPPLAVTVAKRARGLDGWMAAALTVPGSSGAPTRTPM